MNRRKFLGTSTLIGISTYLSRLTFLSNPLKKSKLLLIKYFLDTTRLVFGCLGIEPVEEM